MEEDIPPELILNWDPTRLKLVTVYSWTMDKLGSKQVEVPGINDKRLIIAIFYGILAGDFFNLCKRSTRVRKTGVIPVSFQLVDMLQILSSTGHPRR